MVKEENGQCSQSYKKITLLGVLTEQGQIWTNNTLVKIQ
jgi:hypothetical protein